VDQSNLCVFEPIAYL